ncbi:MAG: tRNA (adenosine(37)-N6)-threonylcarbamoyltransferase complex transferase subunit TsaD [Candidatus Omnitrophota bacterium]
MYVLGIESSCDETCAAVLKNAQVVCSNVVASSLDQHSVYGGVIPEIASRAHLESICSVVDTSLREARLTLDDLDLIAVTQGPGLIGSLLVGISFARALALSHGTPLLGINHVRAHLYAAFIEHRISYPFVGLVVSGGHTNLYRVKSLSHEEIIGSTRDDAAGEAFDKVAKILGLGYPGGPIIEKLALEGRSNAFIFRCDCGQGFDFSFSGIKTAVLYKVNELKKLYGGLSQDHVKDLCASFQEAVVSALVAKSIKALKSSKAKTLVVGGGVAFNGYLRQRLAFAAESEGVRFCVAPKPYCLDNAAMVASLGYRLFQLKGSKSHLKLDSLVG